MNALSNWITKSPNKKWGLEQSSKKISLSVCTFCAGNSLVSVSYTHLQARQLLNDVNGIGVYRNGFRIRPLGDADFDWLKLNEQRVQNPSMKIGSNQVVGYVHVESE